MSYWTTESYCALPKTKQDSSDKVMCNSCQNEVIYRTKKQSQTITVDDFEISYRKLIAFCPYCGKELIVPGFKERNQKVIDRMVKAGKTCKKKKNRKTL